MLSRRRRVWFYSRRSWQPERWRDRLFYIGGDEFGRRTVVLPCLAGYIVVALYTCRCSECRDAAIEWQQMEAALTDD